MLYTIPLLIILGVFIRLDVVKKANAIWKGM